jgi:Zn-dependent M28 family amino/carboxypeptidase
LQKITKKQEPTDQFTPKPISVPDGFWKSTDVQEAIEELDIELWYKHVSKLASINRFTCSPDITEATDYLFEFLSSLPGMEVQQQEFPLPTPSNGVSGGVNIIGRVVGSEFPERIIIVGGHYDSIAFDNDDDEKGFCPGAIDNATGASGVLELARIFSKRAPKVTMEFILYSGEELGYLGSKFHAEEAKESNKDVRLMLNLDMLGWGKREGGTTIEIETAKRFSGIVETLSAAATELCTHPHVCSYPAWGSDHVSYIKKDFPAILITNLDGVEYEFYHSVQDTLDQVDSAPAREILKLQIAVLVLFCDGEHFII